jgi:integrase
MGSESKTGHVRKRCDCSKWKECTHPWYVDAQEGTRRYRPNLDKLIGRHAADFAAAKVEADRAIRAWREGYSAADLLPDDRPTLATLLAAYRKRADAAPSEVHQVGPITKTIVHGRPFGDWPAAEITRSMLEAFRAKRKRIAGNRNLALLRAMFNWAVLRDPPLLTATPWKVGNVAAVKLGREEARTRRLEPGEDVELAAPAGTLRDVITAALETGCRQGELLSLQWRQILPREVFLPAGKTKAKKTRRVPISSVLRGVLDARRHDPAGDPFPPSAYVFGDAVGQQTKDIRQAWAKTVLRAHGIEPVLEKKDGRLTVASRQQLKAIDLHFHDLRREAGSRWMDAGVPLSTIQKWLGHANIAQTSTYLAATGGGDADAMQTYERMAGRLVTHSDAFSSSGLESRSRSDNRTSGNIRLIENEESPMESLKAVS